MCRPHAHPSRILPTETCLHYPNCPGGVKPDRCCALRPRNASAPLTSNNGPGTTQNRPRTMNPARPAIHIRTAASTGFTCARVAPTRAITETARPNTPETTSRPEFSLGTARPRTPTRRTKALAISPTIPPINPNPRPPPHTSDASCHINGAHSFGMGRRAQLFVLLQCGVEHRRALIGRQCVGKVFACSSRLEWIAEPFVFGQCSLEQGPSTGRIVLPKVRKSDGAVGRRCQHGDGPAHAFGDGQECPKPFRVVKRDQRVDHEHDLERRLLVS